MPAKMIPPTSAANPVQRSRPAVVSIFPSSWRVFVNGLAFLDGVITGNPGLSSGFYCVAAGMKQLSNDAVTAAFHALHHDHLALVLGLGHTSDKAN